MFSGVPLSCGHVCQGEKEQERDGKLTDHCVQLIEKSSGCYRVAKTAESFSDPEEITCLRKQPILACYTIILYHHTIPSFRPFPTLPDPSRSFPILPDPARPCPTLIGQTSIDFSNYTLDSSRQ